MIIVISVANKIRKLYVYNVWINISGILNTINVQNVIKHVNHVMDQLNMIVLSVKIKELKLLIVNAKDLYVTWIMVAYYINVRNV